MLCDAIILITQDIFLAGTARYKLWVIYVFSEALKANGLGDI